MHSIDFVKVPFFLNSKDPVYSRQPNLYKNNTLATVSWGNSFTLNGRLREYILLADGKIVSRGITSVGGAERDTKDQSM